MQPILIEKIDSFFKKYKSTKYKKNDTIVYAREIPKNIFYIVHGYIRIYASSVDGKEFTIRFYKPGTVFPMQAIFPEEQTIHYFQTVTDAEIIRVPKEDFVHFIQNDTEILFGVTRNLVGLLSDSLKRLETTILGNARQRVITTLLFLEQRLPGDNENAHTIHLPFTHSDIASLTGLTRETVTLELDKLRNEGLIFLKNKFITLVDLKKMNDLVQILC